MRENELGFHLITCKALIVNLVTFFDDLLVALLCGVSNGLEHFLILLEVPVDAFGNRVEERNFPKPAKSLSSD